MSLHFFCMCYRFEMNKRRNDYVMHAFSDFYTERSVRCSEHVKVISQSTVVFWKSM
jgi:hypothetical protein